jgi:Raf kinase inhibitor-like YbhB/YbcL family protein
MLEQEVQSRQIKGMNACISFLLAAAGLGCLVAASCANNVEPAKEPAMNIQMTSTAFAEGQPIPEKYTCDGQDVSPPLTWSNAPAGTKSFTLVVEDPDAPMGTWVHWVIYDLPADTAALSEGVARSQYVSGNAKQGLNDFGRLGYGGPCPPPGKPHRYFFKLYALDVMLDLKPGATRKELLKAMEGHILGQGQLMGTFQRTRN